MGKRVHFETYGCTTNLGDTRTMQGIVLAEGHELAATPEAADVIVVNTCTVVDTTDEKIGHRLRTLRASGKEVIAAGCMAAARPEKIQHDHPGARLVPSRQLHHIGDAIAGRPYAPDARPKTRLPRLLLASDAIIQLSEGCLFSCAYCLTKTARGDQTSHAARDLVADIRDAVNAGATEIKLTSQDTAGYGIDTGDDLPGLLRRVTDIGGDFRVRVGMMHPRTALRIVDDLFDAMDHPKVYRFLHLPIQTGSERLLRLMERGHRLADFWTVVDRFRSRFPDGTIATDIIVGHPGETEDDHAAAVALLERLDAEHVNITRWSARPGTASKQMPGRVPTDIAKQRSRALTHAVLERAAVRQQAHLGRTFDVLVTEPGKHAGSMLGRGPAYQVVAIRGPAPLPPVGHQVPVLITAAQPTYLVGVPAGASVAPRKQAPA